MVRLRSERAELVLDLDRGGRVASLVVDGLELLVGRVDDPLEWGSYVMAPYAGRVRHGRFTFDDREHALPLNRPPHAQHGTVFATTWEELGHGRIRAPLGDAWPWGGEVEQRVGLTDDGVTFEVEVRATDGPMPVTVGWHPWFRRRLDRGNPLLLDVRPVAAYEVDDEQIPTGAIVPPPDPPWDTAFSFLHSAPRLTWPGALTLEVTSSCTTWVVYSEPEHAVCIEPQTARPDALSTPEATVVTPDQPLTAWMRWAWHAQD